MNESIVQAFKDFDRIFEPKGDINDKLKAFVKRYPKAKGLQNYIIEALVREAMNK